MATFSKRIQLRNDSASNWASANPVLLEGEVGIEIDSARNRIKIGDGTTAWNDLPYFLDAREEEVGDYDDFLTALTTP
mgnify:FL=1|jgi:hypothetical protein